MRLVIGIVFGIASIGLVCAQGYQISPIRGAGSAVCDAYVEARNADPGRGIAKCRIGRPLAGGKVSRPELTAVYLNLTVPPEFSGPAEVQEELAETHSKLLHDHLLPFSLRHDARLARYFNYKLAARAGWRDDIASWSGTQEQRDIAKEALSQFVSER